ncbi:MAG: hemolysin III family protein, partial [Rhodobacterales bacterium]|nr:hemolysin III family protein [Rhodobacterales bacterium]
RRRLLKLRILLYLVLGWLVVGWSGQVSAGLGPTGTALLVAGGLTYTAGVGFYLWRRLPFNGAVWHAFVVAGSLCFFFAIAGYALPA